MKSNLLSLSALLFLALLTFSCSSGDKKDAENTKKEEVKEIPPPPLNLPPGTVSVFGKIISVENETVPKKAVIKIIKVLAYGSAAPVMADDTEIEVTLPDNIMKNVKPEKLSKGENCSILLRNVEKFGSADVSNWICVKFN